VLHGSLGPEDEDGAQRRRGVSGWRGLRLLEAVGDFVGQLAALYDLAVQDVWPPSSSCSAKATLTTDSTLTTITAATTLRIDTLRLIRILLPCVGKLYLYLWLATLQVRVFFPSLG
jgi:hypothetical protein